MNKAKLLACLDALGLEPSTKTFSDRKKMQKLAYLLQEVFGVRLGCSFSWYIHGPYAPNLTRMLFAIAENREQPELEELHDEDKVRLERAKSFLGNNLNLTDKLELLGSLHFLKKLGKSKNVSDLEIIAVLKEKKPFFKDKDIAWAWQKLEDT